MNEKKTREQIIYELKKKWEDKMERFRLGIDGPARMMPDDATTDTTTA